MNKRLKRMAPQLLLDLYHDFRTKQRLNQFRGDRVYCSICESSFHEFAPFGRSKRRNARCPKCSSMERHRLIWKYLHEQTGLFTQDKPCKVLHFAPEQAFYQKFSANPDIEYVPCDLSPEAYRYQGGTKITKVDILDIPFSDETFDVVLCNHVLEHIPDDAKALSELRRVMKKGAWAILMVPIDYRLDVTFEDASITSPKARALAFGQFDHVRYYGKDYPDRLRKAGFDVQEIDYFKTFTPEEQFHFGFRDVDLLYVCTK